MSSLPPGYDTWLMSGPGGPYDDREPYEPEEDAPGEEVAICMGCGCDDMHACETASGDPCYWLRLDEELLIGVCSQCPQFVERFDRGERDPGDDTPGQRILVPGDDEFAAAMRELRARR